MLRRATETTLGRVLLLLSAVAVVLVGSAALAYIAFDEYGSFGAALWSAVLHVLDPSSLQDDEGAAQRAIGLFQVVAGLVLLVGLLFTFVAESFASSLERLGQSDRPVRARDHLLVIGGIDLVPVAVRAAAKASRTRVGFEIDRVVVLAPESARESRGQLRAELKRGGGRPPRRPRLRRHRRRLGVRAGSRPRAILLMPSTSGPVVAENRRLRLTIVGCGINAGPDGGPRRAGRRALRADDDRGPGGLRRLPGLQRTLRRLDPLCRRPPHRSGGSAGSYGRVGSRHRSDHTEPGWLGPARFRCQRHTGRPPRIAHGRPRDTGTRRAAAARHGPPTPVCWRFPASARWPPASP